MKKGAIACGHAETAAAAEEILRLGGNAFDAIIAAHWMACVVEPVLCSLAGGGFLLAKPHRADPTVYDFFAQTPKSVNQNPDFYAVEVDFGTTTQSFHIGTGAIATPGCIAGLFAIHRDLGSLPMQVIAQPAVTAARSGIVLNDYQTYIANIVAPIFTASEEARICYPAYQSGAHLKFPQLADSIDNLAREGAKLFYVGEMGESLLNLCASGGHLIRSDLESYQVIKRNPLKAHHRENTIWSNPTPSSGGLLIRFALQLLEALDKPITKRDQIAALDLTSQARLDVLAETSSSSMLNDYRQTLRARCNRGTTHFSVIDAQGNAAAMTVSNGEGCGHIIPGTGIMANNMLGEQDINPLPLGQWPHNQRLSSMMAPTIIESTEGLIALGSGGSNRIRSAIFQVISNLLDNKQNLSAAIDHPRAHVEGELLSLEPGIYGNFAAYQVDQWSEPNLFFGGVHAVSYLNNEFNAYGDPRRGGVGVCKM